MRVFVVCLFFSVSAAAANSTRKRDLALVYTAQIDECMTLTAHCCSGFALLCVCQRAHSAYGEIITILVQNLLLVVLLWVYMKPKVGKLDRSTYDCVTFSQ
jgi:hypothetical protein